MVYSDPHGQNASYERRTSSDGFLTISRPDYFANEITNYAKPKLLVEHRSRKDSTQRSGVLEKKNSVKKSAIPSPSCNVISMTSQCYTRNKSEIVKTDVSPTSSPHDSPSSCFHSNRALSMKDSSKTSQTHNSGIGNTLPVDSDIGEADVCTQDSFQLTSSAQNNEQSSEGALLLTELDSRMQKSSHGASPSRACETSLLVAQLQHGPKKTAENISECTPKSLNDVPIRKKQLQTSENKKAQSFLKKETEPSRKNSGNRSKVKTRNTRKDTCQYCGKVSEMHAAKHRVVLHLQFIEKRFSFSNT